MEYKVLYPIISVIFFLIILGITLAFSLGFVNAGEGMNATMTVKVDLLGFNTTGAGEISIWVPDEIDLGEVTKDDLVSDEILIHINNTGTVNIRVTPELKDSDETIFNYLFFREQKSDQENIANISRILGDYSVDIDKPAAGAKYRAQHCYIHLDLTEFDGEIREDVNNYNTEIIFVATAR